MLPSSGYFQTINCPFYDSGLCDRPYCHYRHVKKDNVASKESVSNISGLTSEPGNSLMGIGDDQNILQQLVSEAVKKALQGTELSPSVEGDSAACNNTGSEVSSKLVEKVLEGLKPLVAPPTTTSNPVPSYKPTPIAELRKRHIPVPYTPKDTKTILVKRRLSSDGSTKIVKAKSSNAKHREEYVPGVSGKAVSSDVPTYKPFSSQKYGTVQYSSSKAVITNELLYTPSDKSSLPSKAADYVPSGISDTFLSDNLYKPTTRGSSPILEPEYQPDISSINISYTPSKLDSLEEVGSCHKKLESQSYYSSVFSLQSGESEAEKSSLHKYDKQSASSERDSVSDNSHETPQCTSEELFNEIAFVNGTKDESSKSESKEKEPLTSSHSKHSSHQKDQRGEKHKHSRVHTKSKVPKDSKEHKSSKDKDSLGHKSRNGESQKDSKRSKDSKDEKEVREKSQRFHKDSNEFKNKSDRDEKKSKSREVVRKEGHSNDKKDKSQSEASHKSHKESRSAEEKNHSSQNSFSSSDKMKRKSKEDSSYTHDRKHKSSTSSRSKSDSSKSNSHSKHGEKRKADGQKGDLQKKQKFEDCFEEMERLLQTIDRGSNDSDTDEDIREQECLRIFNSYKPDETITSETNEKKRKPEELQGTSETATNLGKKRFAHEGAVGVTRKFALPPKTKINPSQAMMGRFSQLKAVQEKSAPPPQQVYPKPVLSTGKVRIAHVPNVSKLLDAKKNLNAAVQSKPEPTVPQSLPKGLQRVAHVPTGNVTRRPFIWPEDNSKIPTNVRQKYLNIIFDEFLKKIGDTEECSKKSINEELSCYKRSSTRNVYVNLAIITIQRLRNMDASEVSKEDVSGGSKSTVLHEDVIGGKAKAKGLWSIIPAKRATITIDENLAYQMMMEKYVMTEDELTENGYPRPHPSERGRAVMIETMFRSKTKSKSYFERVCDRCGKEYFVNEKGISRTEEQCVYHWGRPYKTRGIGGLETRYSCCQGEARSEGCTVWNCHISDMFDPDNQRGFVQMLEKPDATTGMIYALDCEMCYTTDGLDLLRVTVIDFEGKTVYDTLVKPEKPVLDYSTRFSGITEDDMRHVTKSLLDVQAALLSMFHKRTILIGHSLDSDLKALKLIHDTVVDTSLVFPHRRGLPFKRALKTLCAEYLQKIIQSGEEGHDSAEDALACVELMKWKIKEDLKSK